MAKKNDTYEENRNRRIASAIIDYLDDQRGHTTKGERYYQLEDDLTEIVEKTK